MTDDEQLPHLIEAARRGDEQSFLQIYRIYSGKVRGMLRQMLGTDHLDDHVQEVFLRVWKSLGTIREPAAFSGWIYRTSWNVAMDHRKSAAVRRSQSEKIRETESTIQTKHLPEKTLEAKILVERALAELDFNHRGVIVLVELEDFSMEKAAQIMNIPVGTVKSRLFNARAQIRKFLENQGVSL
jgi:RNA polymerase sigma-70 factor (ECF subfamily)